MTGVDEVGTSASEEGASATLSDEEIETRPTGALETAPDEDDTSDPGEETSDPGDDSADVGDDSDDSGDSGDDSGDDAPAAA